jgi:hydrogenase maturation protease
LTSEKLNILVYGYGNPGRQDDGLGVHLSEDIERWSRENGFGSLHTDSNYQLNLEDAANISKYDVVIFADASGEDMDDFKMEPLKPSAAVEFTMHAVSPAFILHLCNQIFEHTPQAWLLHIRGYEWEFMKEMTPKALSNLEKTETYLKDFLISLSGSVSQCGR